MILDRDNNVEKNNMPLYQSLNYHKNLSDHWLISEIEEMLNGDYSNSVSVGIETYKVPNEAFFMERSKRLQKYFLALINKNNDETAIELEEL